MSWAGEELGARLRLAVISEARRLHPQQGHTGCVSPGRTLAQEQHLWAPGRLSGLHTTAVLALASWTARFRLSAPHSWLWGTWGPSLPPVRWAHANTPRRDCEPPCKAKLEGTV